MASNSGATMEDDTAGRPDVVDSGDAPAEAQIKPAADAGGRLAEAMRRRELRSFAAAVMAWTAATRFHGDGVTREEERRSCPKGL
ncbi:hypothetical protein Scep_004297 [Stephania cephalantha]|uniref:Uncharacterized protein n=1 Tax=Stephania cephalantha TaxID=152367 RepID=A0AAP0KS77_9MAGN